MTRISNEIPTVAIAHARKFENNEKFIERHAAIALKIAHYGANAIALNGAKDRTEGNSFSRFYTFDANTDTLLENNELVHVNSALDITGGIARYTPEVAALNPLGVREIALSKQAQFDTLRGELGDAISETMTVQATKEDIQAALDSIDSEELIIKANTDVEKKHSMLVGDKNTISQQLDMFLDGMDPEKDSVIIQEYMPEVQGAFADGIKYFDDTEQTIAVARKKENREIRVHTIDGRPVLVTGRAGLDPVHKSPEDEWVFFDRETIPQRILDFASTAALLIQSKAEAIESYLAVDLTPDGSRIVEVNGRNIGGMRSSTSRLGEQDAHEIITDALAQKLTTMATRERSKI